MFKRGFVVLIVTSVAACTGGNSTTSPTPTPTPPPASLTGIWLGTLQATQFTTTTAITPTQYQYVQAVSMTLLQSGTTVSGTWTTTAATDARNGTVGGAATATSFTGALTYNTLSDNGGKCTGTLATAGSISGDSLTWMSPGVTENCGNPPTDIAITAVPAFRSSSLELDGIRPGLVRFVLN
jgi:hypothetical protein